MRYLVLIVLVVSAVTMNSCGGCQCGKSSGDAAGAGAAGASVVAAGSRDEGTLPGNVSGDTLMVEVELTERGYALLEPVAMALRVTNMKQEDLTLTFPTAQRFDFIVRKGKEIVWIWSEGRIFAQSIGRKTLGPGETVSYDITWDQSGLENVQPPLGAYTAQGILKTSPEIASGKREFGIVD
jgi:hypothetical protein